MSLKIATIKNPFSRQMLYFYIYSASIKSALIFASIFLHFQLFWQESHLFFVRIFSTVSLIRELLVDPVEVHPHTRSVYDVTF